MPANRIHVAIGSDNVRAMTRAERSGNRWVKSAVAKVTIAFQKYVEPFGRALCSRRPRLASKERCDRSPHFLSSPKEQMPSGRQLDEA